MSDLESRFKKAGEDVKTLSERPDNEMLLKLYAHYKQGAEGDVSGSPPGMMNFVGRAKYDAWEALKGLSKEDAMTAYVELVEGLRKA